MVKHRSKANSEEAQHFKIYQTMNKLGVENFYIELFHLFPCNSLEELRAEEGRCIREYGTLNERVAGRDKKQWYEDHKEEQLAKQKQYYQENKEVKLERNKKWRDEHKEEQKEYHKEYRQNNPEAVAERKKKCYENKKEQYLEKKREYYQSRKEKTLCECGSMVSSFEKSRHLKSQKHQAYLQQQQEN